MNPRFRTFLVAVAFVLASCVPVANARSAGRITGKVSGKNGAGLLGAVVTVFRQDNDGGTISFTRTDKSGAYTLANLTPGSYTLQVVREGYSPLTSRALRIEAGRTATLNIVLQDLIDFVAGDPDPRNWDLKTVIRSTADRRLIFRDLPGTLPASETDEPFVRAGAISVTSSTGLGSDYYSSLPTDGQNGIVTNFAFVEPVSDHGRMIFSGQLNSGYDTYWKVRDTYNYRPDPSREMRISVGYGRWNISSADIGATSRPSQFFSQDPDQRESGLETLGLGFEARNKLLDMLSVEYGFDLSRVDYGVARNFFSPYFQVIVNPEGSWFVKSALASRRVSDDNTLTLSDGDELNLMDPTYITKIDGDVHVSQFKHTEFSVGRKLPDATTLEVAVYEDRMNGPGIPFLVSSITADSRTRQFVQLPEDLNRQRGLRLAMNRKILDYLNGSIAYVYGTGTSLSSPDASQSSEALAQSLLNYMQRSYYHSFMGQLSATFPRTRTHVAAAVRWYPQQPLTPIDLFGDHADMFTKGVNFSIRQPIRLPEFMGSSSKWEAMVDVRNLFDQGQQSIPARDGLVVLTRNPRSVRVGINLNLY